MHAECGSSAYITIYIFLFFVRVILICPTEFSGINIFYILITTEQTSRLLKFHIYRQLLEYILIFVMRQRTRLHLRWKILQRNLGIDYNKT